MYAKRVSASMSMARERVTNCVMVFSVASKIMVTSSQARKLYRYRDKGTHLRAQNCGR